MNLINKLFLLFFIPISMMSQTQGEVIKYMDEILLYHNKFMEDYIDFVKKSDLSDVNKLGLISNLLEDHKLTLSNLEKINKVNWDKGFLSNVISAHKIMDENLVTSKEELESYLNLNDKFSDNEALYNQLRITVKLNKYINLLNSKFTKNQTEIYSQYNLKSIPNEDDIFSSNYNERSNFYNNINLIILPVMIGLDRIFETKDKDSKEIHLDIENLIKTILISEDKINEISIISSGKELFNITNQFLSDWKKFVNDNRNLIVQSSSLKAPKTPEAPKQNESKEAWDNYNQEFSKYEKEINRYEQIFDKKSILFNKYIELYNGYISKYEKTRNNLMNF